MTNPTITGLAAALLFASAAHTATFNVTRTDDPPPDSCAAGDCSLREAIADANLTAAMDDIVLPPGSYLLDLTGTDTVDTGDLDISTDLTITGPATLDGQQLGRIMDIRDGAQVTLNRLRFQNANTSLATNGTSNGGALQIEDGSLILREVVFVANAAASLGGALYSRGSATLDIADSAFVNNSADSGAGIFANSNVTVRNTLFSGNTADLRGAALYLAGPSADSLLEQVTLTDNVGNGSGGGAILFLARNLTIDGVVAMGNQSLSGNGAVVGVTGTPQAKSVTLRNGWFSDNQAEQGGLISFGDDDDQLTISHSTVSGNSASDNGGGLYITGGTVSVTNTTFSGNQAIDDGGAIYSFSATVNLRHVTMTGNTADRGTALRLFGSSDDVQAALVNSVIDGDCSVSDVERVISGGGNREGPGSSCGLDQVSDLVNLTAVQLGISPLRSNPGAAPTHELTPASLARNAGEGPVCSAVAIDQRFQARQIPCSAGAVESNDLFRDSFETVTPLGSTVTVAL